MSSPFHASSNESAIPSLSWKQSGALESATTRNMLIGTRLAPAKQLLEFLPGDGACTRIVLEKLGTVESYIGLEIGNSNREQSITAFADISTARIISIPKSCEFPVDDNSQDIVFACFALNFVRMDQLYMFFSEARRVVHPGGELVLTGVALPVTLFEKIRASFWCRKNKAQCLSLNHYLSPEDWDTKFSSASNVDGIRTETLVYTRRNA